MSVDVLAFGAHPDDIEIFVGGTLASVIRQGLRVGIVHLTRGEKGSRGTAAEREQEAIRAAGVLRTTELRILDLGDGAVFDSIANREAVVGVLREFSPRLVLAPTVSDDHPDHAGAGLLVKSSWYLSGIQNAFKRPEYPAKRPPNLWLYPSHEFAAPSLVIQLTRADFENKMNAIRAYESQFDTARRGEPDTRISNPAFLMSIEARMRYFGALVGVEYGEPFILPKPLGIPSIAPLLEGSRPLA